ncbi:RNA recognition motif-containing protein RRM [Heterostelium album PN500]|uniref:RNA recognition motif-containing protein RRM n=1 Tax=Heterostelium pallidum (strain ATCC 26659 / Pp 5 / PN500) TaxID=670386 RepID=D3BTS9_HETP5|nr:RNA recognition motif-containing protein RRM [Heterostelium album PN500]EFA75115.1 RNA recognition motif-containing protein RRM [Heterostelium album PN500]|eukprot:XP_020427249.1 RNA recognition motif-containing protein RRM [Heterostelium album PN500]
MATLKNQRLPPEVNRILFVKNLPFKITSAEIYELFGAYGGIRQVRLGNASDTMGTAFVVYDDIFDARNACEHLSGYNFGGRYLVVLYHQPAKQARKLDQTKKRQELELMKQKFGIE